MKHTPQQTGVKLEKTVALLAMACMPLASGCKYAQTGDSQN